MRHYLSKPIHNMWYVTSSNYTILSKLLQSNVFQRVLYTSQNVLIYVPNLKLWSLYLHIQNNRFHFGCIILTSKEPFLEVFTSLTILCLSIQQVLLLLKFYCFISNLEYSLYIQVLCSVGALTLSTPDPVMELNPFIC